MNNFISPTLPVIVAVFAICLVCASCSTTSKCCVKNRCIEESAPNLQNDFNAEAISWMVDEKPKTVFRIPKDDTEAAKRPPLLLLHELPGLSKATLLLASQYANEGFTVYTPLLFGKAGEYDTLGSLLHVITSKHWQALDDGLQTRGIVPPLIELAGKIHQQHPEQKMGVIGMCLTGSLPVAFAKLDYVTAGVCSQPSAPFFAKKCNAIGIAAEDYQDTKRRAADGSFHLLALRFEGDTIAKRQRHEFLLKEFAPTAICGEIKLPEYTSPTWNLDPKSHPVLTCSVEPALQGKNGHPAVVAFKESVDFLHKHISQ